MQWSRLLNDALRAIAARAPRHWRSVGGVGAIVIASLAVFTAASAAISYISSREAYDPDPTTVLNIVRPTGVASGDLLLAAITQPASNTISTPSGWTLVATSQTNSTTNPNLRVFYRVATGSEAASYNFTTVGDESMAGGISVFRGIDTANPIAASAVQANNAASTSGVAPSVTPGVADAVLVSVWATHDNGGDDPTVTVPSGMTRVVGSTMMAANTAETRVTMAYQALTAGTATGNRTAALSRSYRSNTASIALRPGGATVSGTVFEDVNYGGGAGRTRSASSGVGVNGATVEVYNSSGVYVTSTTTAGGGTYSFGGLTAGTYHVRVVNSSVPSQRSGTTAALRGVMTYRTTATSGSAVAVADFVGGTNPALVDPGAASSGATFNTGTGVYSAGLSGTAQSVTAVTVGSANITGIDFGFNFSTVVNTNDSGQGSLRQAITNANTLGGDASLAQSGRTAAIEHLVFMISNGTSAAGLRSGNNFFTTSAGSYNVATIAPTLPLPAISEALVIDAQTQPGWTLNPIIELNGASAGSNGGLRFNATGNVVRGLVINRFTGDGINLAAGSNTVSGNWIGTNAAGTAASANTVWGIEVNSSGNTLGGSTAAARNVISGNGDIGIYLRSGSSNVIQGNYIGSNAAGTAAVANATFGVMVHSSTSANTIGGSSAGQGNLISGNGGAGVRLRSGSGSNILRGNIIGRNAAGTAALPNALGIQIDLAGSNNRIGGTAAGDGNLIASNTGSGVLIFGTPASTGNAILGNSIYANGAIGIDLGTAAGSSGDGITVNDGAKPSGQPNLLMDHPVLTSARARGPQLTVAGYIGTAAGQSLFGGSRVEVFVSDSSSSHGSGRTYLGALTADGSGNFSGTITMPITALRAGSVLTATATDTANNTSEFGANFNGLVVDWLINHNGDGVDANPGDGLCETATAGQCTLRAAIEESNARSGADLAAFALPNCPGAGCVITPASALPAISEALTLDAQTQPGWTLAPIVDLRGTSAGNSHGLNIAATGSTVRGLVIGGFGPGGNYSGIYINAGTTTIEGNYIGLAADGSTARANGASGSVSGGVFVNGGSGTVIGGTTAAQRNVLSGNGGAGVWTNGGSATLIGNYIGTDASGSTAVGNLRWGVQIAYGSHQIGGAAAGQGNLISGNTGYQTGGIVAGSSGQTIQGNTIGLNAARTAAIPNADASSTFASGIDLRSTGSGHLIGGTNPGEGNVIAGNAGYGVRVQSQTTRILGNSFYGNQWLGIDLNADGVTANNGTVSGALPNNGMDFPVVTSAGYDGGTRVLTVAGFIGTGSGQAVFAGSRIELFASDADSSGHGEGRDYLGTLTVDGNGRYSGSVTVPGGVSFAVGASLTATATDLAGNTSEFGPNYVVTTMAALVPSSFNLFETSTASNALSGPIKTITAGQARTLAAIAIDSAGSGLAPSFTGSVSLQWMDARDNSGAADAGGCRSTWVAGGSAGSLAFAGGTPRMNANLTPPSVGREWRLRMSHSPASGAAISACTTDNFAIKPAAIAVTALGSADSSTAGVGGSARSLTNTGASGGVVHRAGRPFALRAQGQDAGGAVATGYDGTATIAITSCLLPTSACTLGSLQHNGGAASLTAVAGALSSDTMSYSEVGAITLRLSDSSFADIDTADSTAAERLIESAVISVGRFVPDRYATAVTTAGVLNTVNATCTAAGAGYTFFGQAFGWATAPQFSVTAQNAQGATTVNWAGSLQRLDPAAHVAQSLAVSGVAGALSQSHGSLSLTDLGGGSARLIVQATASFAIARDPAAPVASANPVFGWAAAINDTSEAAVTGNGNLTGTATQSGLAFNSGAVFHTGRLALAPGHGDARRGVRLLAELQRYSAAGWVTMTEDRGCISVAPMNVTVASPQGVFTSWGVCAAPVQAAVAVALRGGRAWLSLPPTPGQAPGRLTAGLNLGSASSGLACQSAGVSAAAQPMNLPHLLGAWGGVGTLTAEPRAALTWGRPNRDMVLSRERF